MRASSTILSLVCVICMVAAQRRATSTEPTKAEAPRPQSRGRGRSRFVATADISEIADELGATPEIPSRRNPTRKRVPEITERRIARPTEKPLRSSYEVEEVVNESPLDAFLKKGRPNFPPAEPAQETTIRSRVPTEIFLDTSIKPRILQDARFEISRSKPPTDNAIRPRILAEKNAEPIPRQGRSKSRAVSETKFDAIPKRSFVQSTPSWNDIPDLSKLPDNSASNNVFQEEILTTQILEEIPETTPRFSILDDLISEQQPPEDIKTEIAKTQPLLTTPRTVAARRQQTAPTVPTANGRRSAVRSRGSLLADEPVTVATRSRVRARPTAKATYDVPQQRPSRRQQFEASVPTIPPRVNLVAARRPAEPIHASDVAKKGPSVFGAVAYPVETAVRPGRKTNVATPEKVSFDIPTTRSRAASHSENSRRRPYDDTVPQPAFPSRGKGRSISNFDESKLEVLPLFESEPKTVRPLTSTRPRTRNSNSIADRLSITTKSTNRRRSRTSENIVAPTESLSTARLNSNRRSRTSDDFIQTSATENDLQYRKPDGARVTVSVNVETRTESTVRRQQRKPQVKESVVAEVNEVTSKGIVSRRKPSVENTTLKPKPLIGKAVSRGTKKSEIKLSNKKNSEEVEESDNYPEEFKAIIQAKKESRLPHSAKSAFRSSLTITNVVTSSTEPAKPSEATRETNDLDNELVHPFTTEQAKVARPGRNRFSLTTKPPATTPISATRRKPPNSRKNNKVLRSTALPAATTPISKESKIYPRFNEKKEVFIGTPRNFSRTSYSSKLRKEERARATRERLDDPIILSTKIPKPPSFYKKSNRNQAKYRSGISSRGPVIRSTTNAPAYIPTIPSAPYVPTVPTITPPSRAKGNIWAEDAVDYNWSFSKQY